MNEGNNVNETEEKNQEKPIKSRLLQNLEFLDSSSSLEKNKFQSFQGDNQKESRKLLHSRSSNMMPQRFKQYKFNWIDHTHSQNSKNSRIIVLPLELPFEITVQEALPTIIIEMNKIIDELRLSYRLDKNIIFFNLHFANKAGEPKQDYPPLDPDQILSASNILSFTLKSKSSQGIVNVEAEIKVKPSEKKDENQMDIIPKPPTNQNGNAQVLNDTEEYCCCFKIKKQSSSVPLLKNSEKQKIKMKFLARA